MNIQQIGIITCLGLLPIAPAQGTELGQDVFRSHCIGCHAMSCNRDGPKLEGVIGRTAGSLPDFDGYSAEMKSSGLVWTRDKLDEFLADPNGTIPGNLMATAGKLENPAERENLIAFLISGDTSLDLCF